MDTRTCYCRNTKCKGYGQTGSDAQLHRYDIHRQAPRFQCGFCSRLVSSRAGTAYAGIRTPETTYRLGAKLLAEGMSIRAAARILGSGIILTDALDVVSDDKQSQNQFMIKIALGKRQRLAYESREALPEILFQRST